MSKKNNVVNILHVLAYDRQDLNPILIKLIEVLLLKDFPDCRMFYELSLSIFRIIPGLDVDHHVLLVFLLDSRPRKQLFNTSSGVFVIRIRTFFHEQSSILDLEV